MYKISLTTVDFCNDYTEKNCNQSIISMRSTGYVWLVSLCSGNLISANALIQEDCSSLETATITLYHPQCKTSHKGHVGFIAQK